MNFGISNGSCLSFVCIRNTNRCLSSMNLRDGFRWIAALKNFSLSSLFILQAIRQCNSLESIVFKGDLKRKLLLMQMNSILE